MKFSKMKPNLNAFLKSLGSEEGIGGVISIRSLLMTGQVEKELKALFMAWLENRNPGFTYCFDKEFDLPDNSRHEIDIVGIMKNKVAFTAETKCTLLDDKSAGKRHYEQAIEQVAKTTICQGANENKDILVGASHYIIHFLVPRNIADKTSYYPALVEDKFPTPPSETETKDYHREHIEFLTTCYDTAFPQKEPALIPNKLPIKDLAVLLVQV